MAERLYPAATPHEPIDFLSIDALAAHLLRQRPGRRIRTRPFAIADDRDVFASLGVFALPAAEVAAFDAGGPLPEGDAFERRFLGFTRGDRAADVDQLTAAIDRIRTAGGLAA